MASKQLTKSKKKLSEWTRVRFDEICKNISNRVDDPKKSGINYYVGLEHLDPEDLIIRRHGTADDVNSSKFRFKKYQILFGRRRAYQRKLAIATREGICSTDMFVLEPLKGKIIPEFLPIFMQSEQFFQRVLTHSAGSLSPRIKWKNLAKQEFDIPPRKEQEKLVEMFDAMSQVHAKARDLKEKYEIFRKSTLEEIMTRGIGHTKFKKVKSTYGEFEEIPEKWKEKPLGSLAEIKGRIGWRGYTVHDLTTFGPLVIGATQISKQNKLDFTNSTHISKEKFEESPEIQVSKNDIILVKTGNTIGKVALVKNNIGDATINPNVSLLKNIRINPEFLFYSLLMLSVQNFLIRGGTGASAQPAINQATLKKINIRTPSTKEQQKIASILSYIDKEIEDITAHISKLKTLQKSLLNERLDLKRMETKIHV